MGMNFNNWVREILKKNTHYSSVSQKWEVSMMGEGQGWKVEKVIPDNFSCRHHPFGHKWKMIRKGR